MSENEPPLEKSVPDIQYAAYPRAGTVPFDGSAEKLLSLYEGYCGLSWVFLVNVVLVMAVAGLMVFIGESDGFLGLLGFVFLIVTVGSYPCNVKIAFGRGWSSTAALVVSLLMGLNSACFCGIVGYIAMQVVAAEGIKAYGLRSGLIGFKKGEVMNRVQQLREEQRQLVPF